MALNPLTGSREDIANLYVGPFSATRSFDVARVELGGDGIVADAAPLKRPNDRQHVRCEMVGRGFQGHYGFTSSLGDMWVAQSRTARLGGPQGVLGAF
jgi:hypothetical protein